MSTDYHNISVLVHSKLEKLGITNKSHCIQDVTIMKMV